MLVHKIYEFYTALYTAIKLPPKRDQYTIGVRLENLTLEILELTLLARRKTGASKMLILNKIDLKLKMVKLFVRMAYEIKSLRQSKYILLEEKLLEIGKILGGWIKKTNTKPVD